MAVIRFQYIPWASVFALIISVLGCVVFIVLFDEALRGFSTQLSTLVAIDSFPQLRWMFAVVALLFIFAMVGFLFVGIAATSVSAQLPTKSEFPDESSQLTQVIASPCVLGALALALSGLVMFWSMIVSISAVFTSFYIIFISTMYTFCNIVDNQCFDFSVLLPAIIKYINDKQKVDLKFCNDKKEALCAAENNHVWPFIGASIFSFIALAGLVSFLMCMTANYTRIRSERRTRKGEHYVMNQGTVDSNSFILTNMGK